ncbi:MAG: hypothetical protein KDA79_17445 [Planctomycetaceae bacterium]|nr:hypothetical protein [Planctomycetaceae bacterium]
MRLMRSRTSGLLSCGAALLLAVAAGCGGSGAVDVPTGEVAGMVTYGGTPVTRGFVNLASRETGKAYTWPINEEGRFKSEAPVVVGPYTVFITPPEGEAPSVDNPNPAPPNPENIPEKYRSEQTSGLSAEISEGENDLKFDLQN